MKTIKSLFQIVFLVALTHGVLSADTDISYVDGNGGDLRILQFDVDVDNDIELTNVRIFKAGSEVVFDIEEYVGGVLINTRNSDRQIGSFDVIWVYCSATCQLDLTNGQSGADSFIRYELNNFIYKAWEDYDPGEGDDYVVRAVFNFNYWSFSFQTGSIGF